MLPKLILTDIDGVWTDAGMYYDENGNEFKKFNTYDSAGILFCKELNIKTGIITGENSNAVKRRADKLKVDYLFLGAKNKLELIQNLCNSLSIDLKDVAYVGDDINDYELLQHVGFSAAPKSSPFYIKDIVNVTLDKNGGEGVFREFVELIIKDNKIDITKLVKNITSKKYNQ
ncbi:HAD hydrolase family protein [uncultured Tenacibaculum sp.]|uniref:KdsC family phosphatase n=1 Tax=uncultured Tenacibaculum sp. TaxID=174713 RepID=UPI0026377E0A|nr:HAD hydrolase family protein [uncultured Tenacibaculum sp.]